MADDSLFSRILSEPYRRVSESYLIDPDGLVADVTATFDMIDPAVRRMRSYIDASPHYPFDAIDANANSMIRIDMATVAAQQPPIPQSFLYAIDGTPAVPHLHYSSHQLYAAAVIGMSYHSLDNPETFLATTRTTNTWQEPPDPKDFSSLIAWLESKDILETNQSWPTTFREYVEREYALQQSYPCTLLDGPIITQNLVTQERGRELLRRLLQHSFTLCGVIKGIHASTIAHRLLAQALVPGEALLIEPSYNLLKRRSNLQQETWLDNFFQGLWNEHIDVWRGVYRPATKAFGFECRFCHLDQVIAVLWSERDQHHLGHEIPFLLNQVDAHLRSRFNARTCQNHLTYMMGLDLRESQLFDEMNERDLRIFR
jgi:hypothetical protein